MSDALWGHQVLIKASIFSKQRSSSASNSRSLRSSSSYCCRDSAAMRGELDTSPSAMSECCTSFVVVTPLRFAPSLIQFLPLTPDALLPGSPPPALLPSHGQWSWDRLKPQPQLIRHLSFLSQGIICQFPPVVLHLVWPVLDHGNLSDSDKYCV